MNLDQPCVVDAAAVYRPAAAGAPAAALPPNPAARLPCAPPLPGCLLASNLRVRGVPVMRCATGWCRALSLAQAVAPQLQSVPGFRASQAEPSAAAAALCPAAHARTDGPWAAASTRSGMLLDGRSAAAVTAAATAAWTAARTACAPQRRGSARATDARHHLPCYSFWHSQTRILLCIFRRQQAGGLECAAAATTRAWGVKMRRPGQRGARSEERPPCCHAHTIQCTQRARHHNFSGFQGAAAPCSQPVHFAAAARA